MSCGGRNLYLTGFGALGHDPTGAAPRLSTEAEYVVGTRLAFTGRQDVMGGSRSDVAPEVAATYRPMKSPSLRLSAEEEQFKGDRQFLLIARGQF